MIHTGRIVLNDPYRKQSRTLFPAVRFRTHSGVTDLNFFVPLFLSGGDPAFVETLSNWDCAPWLEQETARLLNLDESPTDRILTTHFSYDIIRPSFLKVKHQ